MLFQIKQEKFFPSEESKTISKRNKFIDVEFKCLLYQFELNSQHRTNFK